MLKPTGHRNQLAFNRTVWLSLISATVLMTLAFLRMWWQPILADEWDFYRAITNWLQQRSLIPHPQLYIHAAQLSLAVFGPSISSARLVGVFSAIVSVWLIPPLIVFVWPDHPQRNRLIALAVILTALNPLTLQNAMILDIDNTLLTPALMLLLCAWAALQTHASRQRIVVLSCLVALALWVKLPTPPLLLGALGLYHLIRREWKRVAEIIVVSMAGLVVFGITFVIYSQLSGYQLAYFAATFDRTGGFFNLRELLARFPQGLGVFVIWLSLPLTILLLMALAFSLRRTWRGQSAKAEALSWYVMIVAVFYPLVYVPAWGYPRYQAPIVPIVDVLVAALIVPYTANLPRSLLKGFAAVGALLLAFNLICLPDPLWPIYQVTFEGDLFDLAHRLMSGLSVVVVVGLPIMAVLVGGTIFARMRQIDGRLLRVNLLGVLAITSLAVVSFTQVNASYSTRYRYTYDYADFLWSVREVQAAGPTGYTLAIKDVLYESKIPGEEIYDYLCPDCAPKLIDALRSRRIDTLVWTTKEEVRSTAVTANPQVVEVLDRCYTRMTRSAFIVYQLKPGPACGDPN